MNTYNPASSYQMESASGASPVGRVVALYDTILRDFRRAQAAFESGNIETRSNELNHALTVIAHLQNVLDRENGGEAARHFAHFFDVTRAMIVQVNASPSLEGFQKLSNLYASLRQAWQEADQKVPATAPQAPAVRVPVASTAAPSTPSATLRPAPLDDS